MAAIDTPPGLGLPGAALGWFRARPGPRRLAHRGFVFIIVATIAAMALTRRHPPDDHGAQRLTVLLTAIALGGLAVAVRRAQIGVGTDGVRWGWGSLGVRLDTRRLTAVRVYRDAVALVPRRGSTWFLSQRDWDRFEAMRRAALGAGLPCTEIDRDAPWRARLQSYGRFVDALVVLGAIAVTGVAALAL